MAPLSKSQCELKRLSQVCRSLEEKFLEAIEGTDLRIDVRGDERVLEHNEFSVRADMITMIDFSGEVSGFAAVSVDATQLRRLLGDQEAKSTAEMAEDMMQELVNQSAQRALSIVRTDDGVISCCAPRTIYGRISIPDIPCVTRSYRDSKLGLSFCVALDRMESALMRMHRRVLDQEKALREEVSRRRVAEQELERLATVDDLTGCLNRRRFLELATSKFQLAKAQGCPLSVVSCDIDYFKRVNDTYGHAAGDKVLEGFGALLARMARKSDLVGRLGGEEFAFLLPESDLNQASQFADRLRARCSENTFVLHDEQEIHCTLSLGVAELNETDRGLTALLHRADEALYESKRAGRNRVKAAV